MWELYQELGSYTKVGKKMRRNADTVSRYVQEYESSMKVAHAIIDRGRRI